MADRGPDKAFFLMSQAFCSFSARIVKNTRENAKNWSRRRKVSSSGLSKIAKTHGKMVKTGKRDERKLALIGALLLLGVQKWPKRSRHPTISVSSGLPRCACVFFGPSCGLSPPYCCACPCFWKLAKTLETVVIFDFALPGRPRQTAAIAANLRCKSQPK